MKLIRLMVGAMLVFIGTLFTIVPGSILLVIGGLVLLSMDYPPARRLLVKMQKATSSAARKLDLFLLKRKYK